MTETAFETAPKGPAPALASSIARFLSQMEGLQERIRLLEAVLENFPGGISLFDDNLQMVLCNERQKQLLDYPPQLMAQGYPSMEQLFRFNAERGEYGPGDADMHVRRRMALVRRREPHCYDRARPNGTILEVRGEPLQGGGFVTTYLDVTEQRRNQQLVMHMAHHDPLTDLANRMLFNDRLRNAVAHAKRGGVMAVHYLDLDGFKPINDRLGHTAGDAVLREAAVRLAQSVREHDTVARLGGDEFAIVQTGMHAPGDAEILARRIGRRFGDTFRIGDQDVRVGISMGIAVAPYHGVSCDELLIKADNALYRAKEDGRGCFRMHGASVQ